MININLGKTASYIWRYLSAQFPQFKITKKNKKTGWEFNVKLDDGFSICITSVESNRGEGTANCYGIRHTDNRASDELEKLKNYAEKYGYSEFDSKRWPVWKQLPDDCILKPDKEFTANVDDLRVKYAGFISDMLGIYEKCKKQ